MTKNILITQSFKELMFFGYLCFRNTEEYTWISMCRSTTGTISKYYSVKDKHSFVKSKLLLSTNEGIELAIGSVAVAKTRLKCKD